MCASGHISKRPYLPEELSESARSPRLARRSSSGASGRDPAERSISSNAFHIPTSPTPPPVGYRIASGSSQSELLGDLVAHGLLAFDAERLFQRGTSNQPSFLAISDHAAAVADEAVDQREVRTCGLHLKAIGMGTSFGMKT